MTMAVVLATSNGACYSNFPRADWEKWFGDVPEMIGDDDTVC